MKITTGKVVGGKVALEGTAFEEGTSVTVLARDEEGDITVHLRRKQSFSLRLPRRIKAKWFQRRKGSRSSRVVVHS